MGSSFGWNDIQRTETFEILLSILTVTKFKAEQSSLNIQATFDLKGEVMKSGELLGGHFRCQRNGLSPFTAAPFIALSGGAAWCATVHGAVHPSAGDILILALSQERSREDLCRHDRLFCPVLKHAHSVPDLRPQAQRTLCTFGI